MKKRFFSRKRISIGILCILAVACSGIYAISRLFDTGGHPSANGLTELDTGWYYMEGENRVPVSRGESIPFGEDGSLALYLPVSSDGTITTRSALYRVRMFLDGTQIFCYDDSAFPCNDQMRSKIHCDAALRNLRSDSVLSITYYRNGGEELEMPPVFFGTSGDVLLDHIVADGFTLALTALMMLCAIAAMGISIYLAMNHMLDKRFLDVIFFLILCSVWCFCDSGLARYLSHMSAGVEGISFYAFMTLGIPCGWFIADTGSIKKRISMRLVIAGFFANVVAQTVLWAIGKLEFIEMLPATHVILALGIITCVVELRREYLRSRELQLGIILLAFGIVGFGGALALILYWLFKISWYGVIFEVGILGFILLLMGYLCVELVDSLRCRAELKIYERLSREDTLTGLQNRRSFDEYMQKLMESRQPDGDAELLFMDINDLKRVNDQFGHDAGDEMIIGASQCLRETLGPEAACFRIGGDEFCAVIPAARGEQTLWRKKLDEAVVRYNQDRQVRVSLAVGSSRLLDENGCPKRLSDWKQEADLQMYEEKKGMKHRAR